MHCITGFLIFLFCSSPLYSQINKGRKLMESADYEAALAAFENDVERTINKPVSLYEMARIYANRKYDNYDLDKAYQFISRAIKEFEALSSSNKKKVQKKAVSLPTMSKLQQDITRIAWLQYKEKPTVKSLNHFIKHYTTANRQLLDQAYTLRNQTVYNSTEANSTFEGYQETLKTYGKSMARYNVQLRKNLELRLLESYVNEKGWAMYPRFEELFPENAYVLDRVAAYDYLKIRRSQDPKVFQQFITAYPTSPFVKFAKDNLLERLLQGESLADYDAFVRAYPTHPTINRLWKRFYALYTQDGQQQSIKDFSSTYPNYPFQEEMQQDLERRQLDIEKPLYERIVQLKRIDLVLDFLSKYPTSTYIPNLESSWYTALTNKPLLRGSNYFLKTYPNSVHYDEVLELYYKEYVKDGELGTLNQFMMEHPEYKNLDQQQKDLKIAEEGAKLDLSKMPTSANKALYEAYILAAAPKERAFLALQRLLEPSIRQKRWQKAQQLLAPYEAAFSADPTKVQQLKLLLTAPATKSQVLPDIINATNTERVVGIQQQTLFFAREDALYQSTFANGEWTAPMLLPILKGGLEGMYWAIGKENRELAYSKDGDLYYQVQKEGVWSKATAFPEDINRPDRERDVHFSTDGSALLYSSESDQVLDWKTAVVSKNFHGSEQSNSDLFVVLKDETGAWQRTINLGDQINTPFAERHPYLHSDGKTLYFSSEGHGGLGGLDVYYSRRLDDSWTRWSIPVNLGTGVNSADHESASAISSDYKTLYFTRKDDEGQRLYKNVLGN